MVRFVNNVFDAAQETRIRALIERAASASSLEREEIVTLLKSNPGQAEGLFAAADAVRRRTVGDGIHVQGLLEFSNFCRRNCVYCGIRADNNQLERYRMPPEEILRACEQMQSLGVRTVLTRETPEEAISSIRKVAEKLGRHVV